MESIKIRVSGDENYGYIMERYGDLMDLARKKD